MYNNEFKLESSYLPAGDQPKAIKELVDGIKRGDKFQTLLGVTGSGKTFTISNLIKETQRPALVISPNKTLAAQLYGELRGFFPENAVEYFISYYDYYQPEAYIQKSDVYIEKDFAINDEIDRLRLRATSALVEDRRDVVVVASVSCIYSIGQKQDFKALLLPLRVGMQIPRKQLLTRLLELFYTRDDLNLKRGTFRVMGDVIDLVPASEFREGVRIELWGDEIDKLSYFNIETGEVIVEESATTIYPAKLFITTENQMVTAMTKIKDEMISRIKELRLEGKNGEAERLQQRTLYDLEMMKEIGYCSGIENYSMHMSGRDFGDRPNCIFDYFPKDYLLIIDESHITIPQLRAMYAGDRARKMSLIENGFRLPSAVENRPLKFEEVEDLYNQVIFVSATPGDYELEKSEGAIVEQIIRPTGLLDPPVEVRPIKTQIDDLLFEIRARTEKKQRTLITTITKRMSEDLSSYLINVGIKTAYIHSEVESLQRVEIIRDLRLGVYDVLVGVNLLREGLDMPEVSLVAVLDADKEGFLRSDKSLLQVAGRTARNVDGLVILYADKITKSMQNLIDETKRRRKIQMEYNKEHNINPVTVYKSIEEILNSTSIADISERASGKTPKSNKMNIPKIQEPTYQYMTKEQRLDLAEEMYQEMKKAAKELDYDRAKVLRDEIEAIKATIPTSEL